MDVGFVRARVAELGLSREEILRRGRGKISPRSVQRALNTPGTRLSPSAAAALGEILECGARDVLTEPAPAARRIAAFGLLPHAPFRETFGEGRGRPWVPRVEEASIRAALAARRPVTILAAPGFGKTALARRVAEREARRCRAGVLWLDGVSDAPAARDRLVECLSLLPPEAQGDPARPLDGRRFSRLLWSRDRLLVVDGVREAAPVVELVGGHEGPADLLVLVDREDQALELERRLGARTVRLGPLDDRKVRAWLGASRGRNRSLVGDRPGFDRLLSAVAGRPSAMEFAGDLLRTRALATAGDVAEAISRSASVNSPLFRHADDGALRLFRRMGILRGEAIPIEWAAALGETSDAEARSACDALAGAVEVRPSGSGPPGVAIVPFLVPFADAQLRGEERRAALERLLSRVEAHARSIRMAPPGEDVARLFAAEGALLVGLQEMAGSEGCAARLATVVEDIARVLPAWHRQALDPILHRAAEAAGEEGGGAAEPRVRNAVGRWLVAARADFAGAERQHRRAKECATARGDLLVAAEASVERSICLVVTGRAHEALEEYRAAPRWTREGGGSPAMLAQRLGGQAVAEVLAPRPPGDLDGWRLGARLLDEASALVAGSPGPGLEGLRALLAFNRAVAGRVVDESGGEAELGVAGARILEAIPPGSILRAYVHATVGDGAGRGGRQTGEANLRTAWRRLLRARERDLNDALRRIGEGAFYLNQIAALGDGPVPLAAEIRATDAGPWLALPLRESAGLLFRASPLRAVYSAAFVGTLRRFVWDRGGEHQSRPMAELDRVALRVTHGAS